MNFLRKKEKEKKKEVFLDHKRRKTWEDAKTGHKCFMLYARSLYVTWGGREHWIWNSFKDTNEENIEVAKLSHVCWLDVRGKLKMSELSPATSYEVVYEIKLTKGASGWELPVKLRLYPLPNGGGVQERQVSLLEKPRGEWIELNLGSFCTPENEEAAGEICFDLYQHGGHWKNGLIVRDCENVIQTIERKYKNKTLSPQEKQAKIDDVIKRIGSVAEELPALCSDASISRFLRARNWNTKRATKMLKKTFKWRLQYKPDNIKWEDIAEEAETGKIYRANYCDKFGRPVLVMRPGFQIKYLVYCMENAIMNLKQDQEQMVWLVDFQGLAKATVSVKLSRETARILQDHYPERLGLGILYNPPRLFHSSWMILKPFLDPITYQKVKFVYSDDPKSRKIIEEIFYLDKLDAAFGGRNMSGFDYQAYARQMKDDDVRMSSFLHSGCSSPSPHLSSILAEPRGSNASDEGGLSSGDEATPSTSISESNILNE
ncbi:hypothetical protein V6N12_014488 [Hibiscus sabdariffa]|uniref:CRAL-TRIO domain-containing protein n=1 Tax=Hibiscus sabdariffa TaxID=183260 RepID=A0ABR2DLW0_9ROSI